MAVHHALIESSIWTDRDIVLDRKAYLQLSTELSDGYLCHKLLKE
jgi:hypothetical protein